MVISNIRSGWTSSSGKTCRPSYSYRHIPSYFWQVFHKFSREWLRPWISSGDAIEGSQLSDGDLSPTEHMSFADWSLVTPQVSSENDVAATHGGAVAFSCCDEIFSLRALVTDNQKIVISLTSVGFDPHEKLYLNRNMNKKTVLWYVWFGNRVKLKFGCWGVSWWVY